MVVNAKAINQGSEAAGSEEAKVGSSDLHPYDMQERSRLTAELSDRVRGFTHSTEAMSRNSASDKVEILKKQARSVSPRKYIKSFFIEQEVANLLKSLDSAHVDDFFIEVLGVAINVFPAPDTGWEDLESFYGQVNAGIVRSVDFFKRDGGSVARSAEGGISAAQILSDQDSALSVLGTEITARDATDKEMKMRGFRQGLFLGALALGKIRDALEVLPPEEPGGREGIISAFRKHLSGDSGEITQLSYLERSTPVISTEVLDAEMARHGYLWQDDSYSRIRR